MSARVEVREVGGERPFALTIIRAGRPDEVFSYFTSRDEAEQAARDLRRAIMRQFT